MRVEYNFALDRVGVPCFCVETTEGPHKLFQLTTLVLNVLENEEIDSAELKRLKKMVEESQ